MHHALRVMFFVACALVSTVSNAREKIFPERPTENWRLRYLRDARIMPGGSGETPEQYAVRIKKDGFNTLYFSDTTSFNPVRNDWNRASREEIAHARHLARKLDMKIFLLLSAAEPRRTFSNAGIGSSREIGALGAPSRPRLPSRLRANSDETWTIHFLSNAELLERYWMWMADDEGEVIAMFFEGDDAFLWKIPADTQRGWYRAVKSAGHGMQIFGLLGEGVFLVSPADRALYWSADAFDHVILVTYCYSLGGMWGRALNHVMSKDPDGDVVRYQWDYITELKAMFPDTFNSRKLVLPVVQTFAYPDDVDGIIPRERDITLQVRAIHRSIQVQLGQPRNTSMGYFYGGQDPGDGTFHGPFGVYDYETWPGIVARENARLARESLRGRITWHDE